jgi:formylglycine-generating enzyme required for sulfatase activity
VVDLAGGVADWTASTLNDDPEQRICRGGSWQHLELRARAASRIPAHPLSVAPWLGFRLVHAV